MDFELARELKQAGYPQGGDGQWIPFPRIIPTEMFYVPTLEELIEACDASNFMLQENGGEWTAGHAEENEAWGKTPTATVAKLWLALKSK